MNEDEALRLARLALESTEDAEMNFPGGLVVTLSPEGDGHTANITTNFNIIAEADGAEDLVESLKLVLERCEGNQIHDPLGEYEYYEDSVYHLLAQYEDYK